MGSVQQRTGMRALKMPDGRQITPVGVVDVPITVQLLIEAEEAGYVHWDRSFYLREVWVLDLGLEPARDIFVSWRDYGYSLTEPAPARPLAHLAYIIASGARVADARRVLPGGSTDGELVQFRKRDTPTLATVIIDGDLDSPGATGVSGLPGHTSGEAATAVELSVSERLTQRVSAAYAGSAAAAQIVTALSSVPDAYGPLDTSRCTEVIEFTLIAKPKEVSFKVSPNRKVGISEYEDRLGIWTSRGICEKVPWDTPSYGFALMVPKPGGKWRLTINPGEVNKATEKFTLNGGFMPDSMIQEAQRVGRRKIACKFDMAEAFLTMKLGAEARRLSTFTTPVGKYRWNHGYFGWHSFPAHWQRLMMTRVVLPLMDKYDVTMLCWVDDLIIAADDEQTLIEACLECIKMILEFGGRISLDKSELLVTRFDFCGVEADLISNQWRIAPGRVSSLMETPPPEDREALSHVLGLIRYYFFGVGDHDAQRQRMAILMELEQPGTHVLRAWTAKYNAAMYDALAEITRGDWLLVYDPSQEVTVTTDASGSHGYNITANQYDAITGIMRPIAYISKGWVAAQGTWKPQVKEMYAGREAICIIMPRYFPFAHVRLLCDNKNLTFNVTSKDLRVVRWQQDIFDAGCVTRYWIKGEWNTISDYGSRAVHAAPDGILSSEEEHEMHIYAAVDDGVAVSTAAPLVASSLAATLLDSTPSTTVVPGHLPMAPMVTTIADAQAAASTTERATWCGTNYSEVTLGGKRLALYKSRLLVPTDAHDIKMTLMRIVHDTNAHYMGAQRTIIALQTQARVHWINMDDDVQKYISSCHQCQLAKAQTYGKALSGKLTPTIAPSIHHTWYTDMKGPFPHGTGYLLSVVEATTRMVKLRYVKSTKAVDVIDALDDVILDFGTRPFVLRTDGGTPFDSDMLNMFGRREGIHIVIGVPYHSQGQGMVETRFRSIAAAIMATLGHKAPHLWLDGRLLRRLENIINSTFCSSIHGSPYWAMSGREPRTQVAALADWSAANFGDAVLGLIEATYDDYMSIVAEHHANLNAVQQRVLLTSSIAQAITKRDWDAGRKPGDIKVGEYVLVLYSAPNKMSPHFKGPYLVTAVSADGNFLNATHYADKVGKVAPPIHIARVLRFDASRTSVAELDEFFSYTVESVLSRRWLPNSTLELQVKWLGADIHTWELFSDIAKAPAVRLYITGDAVAIRSEYDAVRAQALAAKLPLAPTLALPGVVLPTPVLPLRATTSATPIITAGVSAVLPPVISPTRGGGRGAARGGVSRGGTTRGSGRVTFAGQVATIITVAPSPPMIRGGRGRGRAAAVVSSVITRGGRVSRGRK